MPQNDGVVVSKGGEGSLIKSHPIDLCTCSQISGVPNHEKVSRDFWLRRIKVVQRMEKNLRYFVIGWVAGWFGEIFILGGFWLLLVGF
jgi:hypothetical protein